MNDTFHTQAIILHRRPFKENDLSVSVYSRDVGALELVARGALKPKSKLAGHIEPLIRADLMIVRGKGGNYVGSSVGRDFYVNIKEDPVKMNYAGSALRLIKKETKEGETGESAFIFDLLKQHLDILDSKKKEYELLNFSFFLKFLELLGVEPQLFYCCECGVAIKAGNNFFNSREGGVVCSGCGKKKTRSGFSVSDDCLKVLRFLKNDTLVRAGDLKVQDKKLRQETASVIKSFYEYNFL